MACHGKKKLIPRFILKTLTQNTGQDKKAFSIFEHYLSDDMLIYFSQGRPGLAGAKGDRGDPGPQVCLRWSLSDVFFQNTIFLFSVKSLQSKPLVNDRDLFLLFFTSGKRPLSHISISLQTWHQNFWMIQHFVLTGALYVKITRGSYRYDSELGTLWSDPP